MRKIMLVSEQGHDKVTIEFNDQGIYDTLRKIEQFLRAVGYKLDGQLIVNGGIGEGYLDKVKSSPIAPQGTWPKPEGYTFTGKPDHTPHYGQSLTTPEITSIDLSKYEINANNLNPSSLKIDAIKPLTSSDIGWPFPVKS